MNKMTETLTIGGAVQKKKVRGKRYWGLGVGSFIKFKGRVEREDSNLTARKVCDPEGGGTL